MRVVLFSAPHSMNFTIWESDLDLVFSPEQEEFRSALRRFLSDKSPMSEVRRLMETAEGFDQAVWTQMVSQLGITSVIIPERFGGFGLSQVEAGIIFEELGRCLACLPYLSTVGMGVNILLASGDEKACKMLLPGVAAGVTRLAVCAWEPGNNWDIQAMTTVANNAGQITGCKTYVLDGLSATQLLVLAIDGDGLESLYLIDAASPTLRKAPLSTFDLTRKFAEVSFDSTPARLVGERGKGAGYYFQMLNRALISMASEQVGSAQAILDMAVGYSRSRTQFGRPIGSFQAIKHKCADMLVEVESARSASYYASWVVDNDESNLEMAACTAKSYCSAALSHAAEENIQIHGGIGFTWEHDAHLYLKRAKSSEQMFGTPMEFRERLAERLGIN